MTARDGPAVALVPNELSARLFVRISEKTFPCIRGGKRLRPAGRELLTAGVAIVFKSEQLETKDYCLRRWAGSARPIPHFFPGFLGAFVSHHQRPASHSAFHAASREDAALRFDGRVGIGAGLRGALLSGAHGRGSLFSPQSGRARACHSPLGR